MRGKEGEDKALFGWKPFVLWSKTYYSVNEGHPIFSFMKDMLNHMGFPKSFPYQEMDDWSERTDLGVINEWEKKTEMERVSLWFSAFTPSSAKTAFVPEFAQYRDLIFQTKMVMDYDVYCSFLLHHSHFQMRENNPTLFTNNKLWFTRQLLPSWEPGKGN